MPYNAFKFIWKFIRENHFTGTPEFAATALAALLKNQAMRLWRCIPSRTVEAVTSTTSSTASAVKQLALENNIPVYQPLHFKSSTDEGLAAQAELKALNADVMVVAVYGLILPQVIFDTPKYGCLNIHGSIAAALAWCRTDPSVPSPTGDAETGVTIMKMAAGLDTGDMMYKPSADLSRKTPLLALHDKLASQGAEAIVKRARSEEALQHYLDPVKFRMKADDGLCA